MMRLKLPSKEAFQVARNKAGRYATAVLLRTLGAILVGGIFLYLGYRIDYDNIEKRPATDFLQYTQFTVNNARVGDDVNLTVCRKYDKPYYIQTTLSVYVIQNPGTTQEKPIGVYGRSRENTLSNQCENRVVTNEEYAHKAGLYEMRACIDFKVRYDIPKQVCINSNRYQISDVTRSLQEQIDALKRRQRQLEKQRDLSAELDRQSAVAGESEASPQAEARREQSNTSSSSTSRGGGSGSGNSNGGSGNGNGNGGGNNGGGMEEQPSGLVPGLVNGVQDLSCGTIGLLCR